MSFPEDVSIPNTKRIDFAANGHRYSIGVALPFEPPPPEGYGILYVIDGYWFFGGAAEIVRNWCAPGVAVVGIDYPRDADFAQSVLTRYGRTADNNPSKLAPSLARWYDLTLPASDEKLEAQRSRGSKDYPAKSELVGGLDAFLDIIETEIKPRVASLIPVNTGNQALFGASLAGLAALHALFVEPNAFRTFLISSPSIWWNDKAVLRGVEHFAAEVTSGRIGPRILVMMGELESTLPNPIPASWKTDKAAAEAQIEMARMVENARELVDRLKALRGNSDYVVEDYALFDRLDHGAMPWAALTRGVAFAFPRE